MDLLLDRTDHDLIITNGDLQLALDLDPSTRRAVVTFEVQALGTVITGNEVFG